MKYGSGAAFRMALEERLRQESSATGVPLVRLRKTVAFDRMLARLTTTANDAWVLKGGFALQIMFTKRARTTKDMDLHIGETLDQATRLLTEAALFDLGDYFSFTVSPLTPGDEGIPRFDVEARLDGRVFEEFHIDLGTGEPMVGRPVLRTVTELLAFAGVPRVSFPCYPLAQHLAEKIHALSRPRGARANSRTKDLVDIVLLAEASVIDARELRSSLDATFAAVATHAMPLKLPSLPSVWAPEYHRMAKSLALRAKTLEEGERLASELVDPVLEAFDSGRWCPERASWLES